MHGAFSTYKASLVKSAVTQVEVVTLHGIDHIPCLGAALMSAGCPEEGG